ncbi:hypothetical protein BHE74_00048008 [Ensete ventricosum]|nr:hypothetical protein GW17_00056083 [Ensete ventricosum]RWW46079.1 hypothetical protein BHE74_00048008 [Ensete ventricosum]RZS23732.1 hypothetical protein BHM03_00056708 [Ensete ventricosum]
MARPVAAKAPFKGATGHDQSPMQGQPPACATARGHGWRLQGSARGQASGGGCSLRGSKGQPRGQGHHMQGWPLLQGQHPRKAAPPAREVPPEGNNACHRGGCPR